MTTRQYSSRSQQSTLTGAITSGATAMTVVSGTALLGGVTIPAGRTFTLVIDVDTALEEIVDATAVSTNTFTITRAVDGSTAQDHSAGATVRHMAIGRDYRDANLHTQADASYNDGGGNAQSLHGIGAGEGVVVGTLKTQTLTNKTLTSPTITNPSITGAGVDASIVFEGATVDAYETTLTVVDPTQDNTITLPNTTGTVVIATATQTLTNKTLTSPVISGSPVITGLSSAGMVSSSATPKDYVDSILGSATAAATSAASAATSAASAATSASSASTSASNALTSANSASTSATAAATSATSAAASATAAATSATSSATSASAAATSATSAAASATAAATSATSAAASALTAANSVATIAGYATTASNSASAAATSATSAAASATAAATSATSASASATAAATSATSAAASATAASTSASSASTSASSALTSANSASTSASAAATSETNAATSASSASTSASSALTSANSASTSASSALTSANSAATSAASAATSYDEFDDRYLGDKTSDPTVDNDGNPLLTGALYFNTVVGAMKVYDGSAWDLVAPDTSNFIDKSILSGKGSLLGASAASTPYDITPAATNGYILSIDSATTSGLAWIAPNPGDITEVTAGDGLTGGGSSGDVTLAVSSDVLRTTGGQVISANTSANALEIRQTGTGKSFVVEDDTNPDSSPFVIDATGDVGVGTSNPANFNPSTTNNNILSIVQNDQALTIGSYWESGVGQNAFINSSAATSRTTATNLVLQTGGTERMRITSTGLVGIGNTPSGAMVQIFNSTAANVGTIIRGAASQSGDLLQIQNSAGSNLVRVASDGTTIIGTSSGTVFYPGFIPTLQVIGTGPSATMVAAGFSATPTDPARLVIFRSKSGTVGTQTAVTTNDQLGRLEYSGTDGSNYNVSASIWGAVDGTVSSGVVPGRLVFNTANTSGTITERMRIDSSGNVGIGATPSSTVRLLVADAVNASRKIVLRNNNSGSSALTIFDFGNDTAEGASRLILNSSTATAYGGANSFNIVNVNNAPITLWTNNTERMRIDGSGNVNVGTGTGGGTNTGGLSIRGEDVELFIVMGAW